jgi:hypothetical protein
MLALLPSTLGLGSAFMWLQSLHWPLDVDELGLTLRNHRRVKWGSITKIGVSRSYVDGHVSEIRIHDEAGVRRIPTNALQDGQRVVRTILTIFKQADRGAAPLHHREGCRASVTRRNKTDARMLDAP